MSLRSYKPIANVKLVKEAHMWCNHHICSFSCFFVEEICWPSTISWQRLTFIFTLQLVLCVKNICIIIFLLSCFLLHHLFLRWPLISSNFIGWVYTDRGDQSLWVRMSRDPKKDLRGWNASNDIEKRVLNLSRSWENYWGTDGNEERTENDPWLSMLPPPNHSSLLEQLEQEDLFRR